MLRWCAPLLAAAALLGACGQQIVLGDSENALPVASGSGNASAGSNAGGSAVSGGGTAGSSGSSGAAGGAGTPLGALPQPGELVWSADHELGDISQWERGGPYAGGEYEWGDNSL